MALKLNMTSAKIKPDYDLILYYYTALQSGVRPSFNYKRLIGMVNYVNSEDGKSVDMTLKSMLSYVMNHIE